MNLVAKVIIPEKEWIIFTDDKKIGSVSKIKKGYAFLKNGIQIKFKSLEEINSQFGESIFDDQLKIKKKDTQNNTDHTIYDFPCGSKPYRPVFNIKKKLPLYAKNSKSKSQYCAGYYIIKFSKGWAKAFCPKLITLERYPFKGPFKQEKDMKEALNNMNRLKPLNTIPIEDFLDKARIAIKSNQKNLTLSIKEVTDLQNSLSVVMTRLSGEIDNLVSKNDDITIKIGGGKF